jgi:hypothetical protein
VSTRNSHAAKAGRRAVRATTTTRPATRRTADKARIAEAVHQAVCEVTGTDGLGQCIAYAWSGAAIAEMLTGRTHYMQAGSCFVYCADADDDGAPYWLGLGPGDGYTSAGAGDLHAWFIEMPAGGGPAAPGERRQVAHGELTLADLTLRHFRRQADLQGVPWDREPLPAYCWDTMHTVHERLKVRYAADAECMAVASAAVRADMPVHVAIGKRALRLLGRLKAPE